MEILQIALIILISTALVYWLAPTLNLRLLLVWGGPILFVYLIWFLRPRR